MQKIPILKIGSNLIVSIQYDIDDRSALKLQDDLLKEIQNTGAVGVLIELSALDMIDSFMGRTLSDIAKMSSSMNAETILCGIQPAVAITLVELGLKLEGVQTRLNIEEGLAALENINKEESEENE